MWLFKEYGDAFSNAPSKTNLVERENKLTNDVLANLRVRWRYVAEHRSLIGTYLGKNS